MSNVQNPNTKFVPPPLPDKQPIEPQKENNKKFTPPPLPRNDSPIVQTSKNVKPKVQAKRSGKKKKYLIFTLLTVLTVALVVYFADHHNKDIVDDKIERDIEDDYIIDGNQPEVVSSTLDDVWFGITEFAQREGNIIYSYSDSGDYLTEFSISPLYEDLEDFMITTVKYDDDGTEYIGEILDYIGAVSVGEVVNMQFELTDLDTRGIVYSDRNGYNFGYAININGYDGSIVITPLVDYWEASHIS